MLHIILPIFCEKKMEKRRVIQRHIAANILSVTWLTGLTRIRGEKNSN